MFNLRLFISFEFNGGFFYWFTSTTELSVKEALLFVNVIVIDSGAGFIVFI
jgi:hypothetical protein